MAGLHVRRLGGAAGERRNGGRQLAPGALAVAVACICLSVMRAPCAHARLLTAYQSFQSTPAVSLSTVDHPIARGETFGNIMARYGIPLVEINEWYQAARAEVDLNHLVVGESLGLSFADGQQLIALRYAADDARQVVVERVGGQLAARSESRPVDVRVVALRGIVRDSFYASAKRAGLPDPVISAMVDLLGSELDFTSDVHAGDRYRVLYEQRSSADGQALKPGRVLATDYIGQAATAAAFLYEDDGEATYVDAEGRPLEGAWLRYPLEFTRITSTFSSSRFHPILKRRRPHLGVDFAAPPGTPVRAVGSGTVRWANWKGGFGRHIEIDHGSGFVSAYSHLRGIAGVVKPRARVVRGQVLGWVGQTGLATGPHLHFALFDNGGYVNPLTLHHRAPQPVRVDREQFQHVRASLAARLRAVMPSAYRPASSTPPSVLSSLAQVRQRGPVVLTL